MSDVSIVGAGAMGSALARAVWLSLLVSSLPSAAAAQVDVSGPKQIRILFIGNSYTYFNDLPQTLQSMAAAGSESRTVHVASVAEGGATLRSHWTNSTRELIRRGAWDYVVLQEQSLLPLQERARFLEYGMRFANEVRASNGQPVLYMTWSRRGRDAAQDSLNDAYVELARATGATIVPVGPAWEEFRQLDAVSSLYTDDGSHPSRLGSFVAASAFHRVLFRTLSPDSYGTDNGLEPRTGHVGPSRR